MKLETLLAQARKGHLPRRLLVSGTDAWAACRSLAAALQQVPADRLALHADTLLWQDDNEKIKIGKADEALDGAVTVRALNRWAAVRPTGAWRLVCIQNAERMTPAAANACLKLIEEPAPRTRFLWSTTNPQQVITTLRSRLTHHALSGSRGTFVAEETHAQFLSDMPLLARFALIESIDKAAKKANDKALWRATVDSFLAHARAVPTLRKTLPRVAAAHRKLAQNANPRLTLEHLAVDLYDAAK